MMSGRNLSGISRSGDPAHTRSRNHAGSPATLPPKEGYPTMAPKPSQSNLAAPNPTPIPVEPPAPAGAAAEPAQLDGLAAGITMPGGVVSTGKTDLIRAQATDPPWWRFVFFLFDGREGQWWSAILVAVSLVLLFLVAVAALVMIATLLPGGPWISGLLGVGGSLTGGTFLWRRRRNATSR
jgi:hypothetical protein